MLKQMRAILLGRALTEEVECQIDEILHYMFSGPCLYEDRTSTFTDGVVSGSMLTQVIDSVAVTLAWPDCLPIAISGMTPSLTGTDVITVFAGILGSACVPLLLAA